MKRFCALLIAVLLLAGCAAEAQPVRKTLFCMDTVMDFRVCGNEAEAATTEMSKLLMELEETWSVSDEDSLIFALNGGSGTPTPEQQALLDATLALRERTNGAFDPKLHGLITAWGFLTDDYRVPAEAELAAAKDTELWNLGAAVKGYAGQRLAEMLKNYDVDWAMLNLGGNIQTYGEKPDGSPWRVAVQNPDLSDDYLGIVAVTGTMSVVTSGDYQRYFELNGKRYHHILDPETGYPAESGLASVTVICRDGMTADALSTALFVMGLEDATAFWRASDDFEAVFVTKDGKIYATEGVDLSECEYEVIKR